MNSVYKIALIAMGWLIDSSSIYLVGSILCLYLFSYLLVVVTIFTWWSIPTIFILFITTVALFLHWVEEML